MNRQLAGTISGFAATVPMSAAMLMIHQVLPEAERGELPPVAITEQAAVQAGVAAGLDQSETEGAAIAAHFAYGAATGAAYAGIAGFTKLSPAVEGALYGVGVWAGSYLGLMPASNLYRSARLEPVGRNAMMIAAHVVWGAALGVLFDRLATPKR